MTKMCNNCVHARPRTEKRVKCILTGYMEVKTNVCCGFCDPFTWKVKGYLETMGIKPYKAMDMAKDIEILRGEVYEP